MFKEVEECLKILKVLGFVRLPIVGISISQVKEIEKGRFRLALLLRNYLKIGDVQFAVLAKRPLDPCKRLKRKAHLNPFGTSVFHNRQDWGRPLDTPPSCCIPYKHT